MISITHGQCLLPESVSKIQGKFKSSVATLGFVLTGVNWNVNFFSRDFNCGQYGNILELLCAYSFRLVL
jgi:hypothetical protein